MRELSAERFNVDERGLALIVDAVQRYKDFLGELELADFSEAPVMVRTEGQTVKFTDIDKLANWLSEHME